MAAPTDSSVSGLTAVRLPRSPPLKVLAEQLRRDLEGGPGSWRLSRAAAGREPLELTAVWMQGTVVEAGGGEARLRDPSGSFSVRGLERVPRGRPCLVPGKYVMVMGVVQACSPEPCLQAVKMTDLSDNPLHESLWELEVEDLHRNLMVQFPSFTSDDAFSITTAALFYEAEFEPQSRPVEMKSVVMGRKRGCVKKE